METETPVVCLVADDHAARENMDGLIRSAGFNVQAFASAREFLLKAAVPAPLACLVLAVRRPVSDGLNLLKATRSRSGFQVPLIFVTNPGDIPASFPALRTGNTELLTRPVRDYDLLSAIRRLTSVEDEAPSPAKSDHLEELEAAAQIQQGLMALTLPQPAFVSVTGMNLPCGEIGGDFYTAIAIDDALMVAIADVAGKGIAAAVMASALQGMIHEGLRYNLPLVEIARDSNEFLAERDLGPRFATCIIARLGSDGLLEYLNCGHVPPLVVSHGKVVSLPGTNVPVGIIRDVDYQSAVFQLSPGDRLVLVTDGVTEAEAPAGDFFGYERLTALARKGLPLDEILNSVRRFRGDLQLNDDCTIIGLEYTGLTAGTPEL